MSTNPLSRLFGSNPFTLLQEHMVAVLKTVEDVPELFDAYVARDFDRVEAAKTRIIESEAKADLVKHGLRERLPKSLFLPVDRRDLLEILDVQDSIADVAQDIAELVSERRMEIPAGSESTLLDLVKGCVDVCTQSGCVVAELDELLAMGFSGREAELVENMVAAVNAAEDVTDDIEEIMRRKVFEQEDGMSPVNVIFWYHLIESIGDLADYAEKVTNRLRLLIAR